MVEQERRNVDSLRQELAAASGASSSSSPLPSQDQRQQELEQSIRRLTKLEEQLEALKTGKVNIKYFFWLIGDIAIYCVSLILNKSNLTNCYILFATYIRTMRLRFQNVFLTWQQEKRKSGPYYYLSWLQFAINHYNNNICGGFVYMLLLCIYFMALEETLNYIKHYEVYTKEIKLLLHFCCELLSAFSLIFIFTKFFLL